jgi:hypothetical protein
VSGAAPEWKVWRGEDRLDQTPRRPSVSLSATHPYNLCRPESRSAGAIRSEMGGRRWSLGVSVSSVGQNQPYGFREEVF